MLSTDRNDPFSPRIETSPSSQPVFTVRLSSGSAVPVTVDYSAADGTATAGSDYTALSGTVTFAPGETTKPILGETLDELLIEAPETFVVNLTNACPSRKPRPHVPQTTYVI